MEGKKLVSIGITVVLVVGLLWWKFRQQGQASDAIQASIMEAIVELPVYGENQEWFDTFCEYAHGHAFRQAYDAGSRRRSASFDDGQYLQLYFEYLIEQAEATNRKQVIPAIRALQADYLSAVEQPQDGDDS